MDATEALVLALARERAARDRLSLGGRGDRPPIGPTDAVERLASALRGARLAQAAGDAAARTAMLVRAAAWGRILAAAWPSDPTAPLERPTALLLAADDDGPCRVACAPPLAGAPLLLQALAAAVLACDAVTRRALTRPGLFTQRVAAARAAGMAVGTEDFWVPLGQAFVAFAEGGSPDTAELDALPRLLAMKSVSALDPAARAALLAPLVPLLKALASQDRAAWDRALGAALDAHRSFFAMPSQAGLQLGGLALEASALAALAQARHGWPPADDPLLAPAAEAAAPLRRLTRVEPLRRVADARDAHWWLDLAGAPRDGRQHRLRERAGELVVEITVADGGIVDRWQALDVVAADAPAWRPEALLAVSDRLAAQVDAGPGDPPARRQAQRALLAEALEALDGALASPALRGDRERLDARRAAYVDLLQSLGQPASAIPPPPSAAAADPRALAALSTAVLQAQLEPLLRALGDDADGAVASQLRPRDGDWALAFQADRADAARAAYDAWWAEQPPLRRAPARADIEIHLAPAGLLGEAHPLSRPFPSGYRGIAGLLAPHRVWAAWTVTAPGRRDGTAYDGLVWLDDHWAWFPKPYRVLAPLVSGTPPA